MVRTSPNQGEDMRFVAVFLSGCYSPTIDLNRTVPGDEPAETSKSVVADVVDCSKAPSTRLGTLDEVSHCDGQNCDLPATVEQLQLVFAAEQAARCRRGDGSVYVIYLAFGMNRTNCPCGQDTQLGRLGLSH